MGAKVFRQHADVERDILKREMKTKNKPTLQVFKVVRILPDGSYASYIDHTRVSARLTLAYVPGKVTKPKVEHTKLWAFTNLPDAREFVARSAFPRPDLLAIFRAKGTDLQAAKLVGRFYNDKERPTTLEIQRENRQAQSQASAQYPSCVHCSTIELIEQIA